MMAENNNNGITNVQDETFNYKDKIENVRTMFLMNYLNDPKSFCEKDINMIKADDWWTLRFIKWNRNNEEKALKQMINAFKWRKSFGINDRDVKDIPIEFTKTAALFPLGTDYKGRNVIYIRAKVYRKIQVLNNFFQQFVAGIIDYVDRRSGSDGYVLVFDVSGMTWANIDFEFLQFMIQLLQVYYPYGLKYTICHNVPRFLRPIWSMAKRFVVNSEKTFRFSEGDEIKKYIPSENLPRYLGGECDFDFTNFAETRQCLSIKDLAPKYGFTPKEVEKYYKLFEPNLHEAERLAKCGTVQQQQQA